MKGLPEGEVERLLLDRMEPLQILRWEGRAEV
jgi:hypothetical protein